MSKKKKRRERSLKTRIFWSILWSAVIIFILVGLNEFIFQVYDVMRDYKNYTSALMSYATSMTDHGYLTSLKSRTEQIYNSLSEDERQDPFTEEYRDHFIHLEDEKYKENRDVLVKCRKEGGLRNVFFFFPDVEHDRIIYLVDGDDPYWAYVPGQWIYSSEIGRKRVIKSSWILRYTHEKEYGWIGTNYLPVYADDGSVLCYIGGDINVDEVFRRGFRFCLYFLILSVVVISILAMIFTSMLNSAVISHVNRLSGVAVSYASRDKVEEENSEEYFPPLNIETGDEIETLWKSLCNMERDMNETLRGLRIMYTEQERMETELSVASEIQNGLLPKSFPKRPEFLLYGLMKPAREVAGDLYDIFFLDEDHLALVVGDVSGKGVSAALFMTITMTLIRDRLNSGQTDPGSFIGQINDSLAENNEASLFVTLWLGILTISTGRLVYVNAGHEYPALCRSGGKFELLSDEHSVPVGAMAGVGFVTGELTLNPGDTVFQYSDGIPEANDPEGELFGEDRLIDALNLERDDTPEELGNRILEKVKEFAGDAPRSDDITILCIKYLGPRQ